MIQPIEVGKFYKTRSGFKVRIYAVDGTKGFPIHGAFFRENEWLLYNWKLDGSKIGSIEDSLDIVGHWTDVEIGKSYAWIDTSGYLRILPYESLVIQPSWRRAFWMDEK